MAECMVHGCSDNATEEVLVYPNSLMEIPKGHGHKDLKAKVCHGHKELYDQQGFLGGLHVPDDPERYYEVNKPVF